MMESSTHSDFLRVTEYIMTKIDFEFFLSLSCRSWIRYIGTWIVSKFQVIHTENKIMVQRKWGNYAKR